MVYITPKSSAGSSSLLQRNPMCLSGQNFEIFEDSQGSDPATTPTKNLRSCSSFGRFSAPAKILRQRKTLNEISGAAKVSRQTRHEGHPQRKKSLRVSPDNPQEHNPPSNAEKTLRRYKTVPDLRSSTRTHQKVDNPKRLAPTPDAPRLQQRTLGLPKDIIPLQSRTNQKKTMAYDKALSQLASEESVGQNDRNVSPDDLVKVAWHPKDEKTVISQAPVLEQALAFGQALPSERTSASVQGPASLHTPGSMPSAASEQSPISDHLPQPGTALVDNCDADETQTKKVAIENLSAGLSCPADFFQPIIRSRAEYHTPECWFSYLSIPCMVQHIDVTTSWKGLSPANAEDLFHIHTTLRDALEAILQTELSKMSEYVQLQYQRGNVIDIEGWKTAVEHRYINFQSDQLTWEMGNRLKCYLSEETYQKPRSALLRLYLAVTECFVSPISCLDTIQKHDIAVGMHTSYDSLSRFCGPHADAESFLDTLILKELTHAPREGQELRFVPQYVRNGAFRKTMYPMDVNYYVEDSIPWLSWDVNIKGFRGRVPIYSAFSKLTDSAREHSDEQNANAHVLKITIRAVFTQCSATGPVNFERTVRTGLTYRIPPSVTRKPQTSVYGLEEQGSWTQNSADAEKHPSKRGDDHAVSSTYQGKSIQDSLWLPKRTLGPPPPVAPPGVIYASYAQGDATCPGCWNRPTQQGSCLPEGRHDAPPSAASIGSTTNVTFEHTNVDTKGGLSAFFPPNFKPQDVFQSSLRQVSAHNGVPHSSDHSDSETNYYGLEHLPQMGYTHRLLPRVVPLPIAAMCQQQAASGEQKPSASHEQTFHGKTKMRPSTASTTESRISIRNSFSPLKLLAEGLTSASDMTEDRYRSLASDKNIPDREANSKSIDHDLDDADLVNFSERPDLPVEKAPASWEVCREGRVTGLKMPMRPWKLLQEEADLKSTPKVSEDALPRYASHEAYTAFLRTGLENSPESSVHGSSYSRSAFEHGEAMTESTPARMFQRNPKVVPFSCGALVPELRSIWTTTKEDPKYSHGSDEKATAPKSHALDTIEENLLYEEQAALKAAMEASREDETLRKMRDSGFKMSFDDIFDVTTTNETSENDATVERTGAESDFTKDDECMLELYDNDDGEEPDEEQDPHYYESESTF